MIESLIASPLLSYGIIIGIVSYVWGHIYNIIQPYLRYVLSKCTTTVVIKDDTMALFHIILALQHYIPKHRGRFKLTTVQGQKYDFTAHIHKKTRKYSALVPGYGMHIIKIAGKTCFLSFSKRDLEHGGNDKSYEETISIWMPFSHPSDINVLIEEGETIAKNYEKKTNTVKIYTAQKDEWIRSSLTKTRSYDSIILPDVVKKDMANDISEFMDSEEWYMERGLPYKRGYLLHGVPGTGKSSLVSALAGKYRCSIYIISLSSTSLTDSNINILMKDVDKHSIVLFEDIDRIQIANKDIAALPKDNLAQLTLSGLLNAIDGIDSGNGHMLFMTANNPEILDSALIRSGRIDRKFEFTLPTRDLIYDFTSRFFKGSCDNTGKLDEITFQMFKSGWSIADCQSYLLQYKMSIDDAIKNFDDVIINKQIGNL